MANIKTIALNGAEIKAEISGQNCAIRNDGTDTVYASRTAGVAAGADGVLAIPAGQSAVLRDTCGALFLLGTGSVQLVGADYDSVPFKTVSASGGSGVDDVARAAVSAHASNAAIHLTEDKLNAAVAEVEEYADSADSATLNAAKAYADSVAATGGVAQDYVDNGDAATLAAAKAYTDEAAISGGRVTQTYVDNADSDTLAAAKSYAAPLDHTHTTSDITDFPTALPADGGNAATVNGHTVNSDVPANAKFTDTVYTHPAYTAQTGAPTANQTPAFGGSFAVTQPVSDSTGHITAMTSRTVTIPSTAASASAAGLVTTGAQTLAGNKTFNGQILPNGATAYGTPQARKLSSGTDAATTTNCPVGAWYGQHS